MNIVILEPDLTSMSVRTSRTTIGGPGLLHIKPIASYYNGTLTQSVPQCIQVTLFRGGSSYSSDHPYILHDGNDSLDRPRPIVLLTLRGESRRRCQNQEFLLTSYTTHTLLDSLSIRPTLSRPSERQGTKGSLFYRKLCNRVPQYNGSHNPRGTYVLSYTDGRPQRVDTSFTLDPSTLRQMRPV